MAEERVQRRLAAILAADVVGYSRLIRADEAGTLAQLKVLRKEVFDPRIAEHNGRIVKTMGDGVLVEFPSAVDAAQSAIKVQRALSRRNEEVPLDYRVELRIGINLGDIVVDGEDIFGDGVNVAARIEELCDAGEVYVSAAIHDQIEGKFAAALDDLGEHTFKNIDKPIRVYRVSPEAGSVAATVVAGEVDRLFDRPAIAVLPFENIGGDPDQEYFADGLTEDIITALSMWRSFPVIARNSTFSYKGTSPDIRKVGEELGARYVVEGSVRKAGNRIRVTAQLINSETGHHLWADRYDRELSDIFALQDEITVRVTGTVAPELERWEIRKATERQPQSLDAWGCVHRGMAIVYEVTTEGLEEARNCFERAIELDPTYSRAYSGLAYTYSREVYFGVAASREEALRKSMEFGRKALTLDEFDTLALLVVGIVMTLLNHPDATKQFERAIVINPSDATAHAGLGMALIMDGEPDFGIPHLDWALQLSPRDPRIAMYFGFLAHGHLTAGRYDVAAEKAREARNLRPNSPEPYLLLAAALGHLGRLDEANTALTACERIQSGYALPSNWAHHYTHEKDNEHFLEGLRKSELPE
jgi:adenylate cyclase